MPRPALPPEARQVAIPVRLTRAEWDRLARIAKASGISRAQLIRSAVARIR